MKLAISNIAWEKSQDEIIYKQMKSQGFLGLEIAPTRIFPESPYEELSRAKEWAHMIYEDYGFVIPSMQSIWFGRSEGIFESQKSKNILSEYTKRAILFAQAIGCKNLVFGCPKNRNIQKGANPSEAVEFFKEISDFAYENGCVIGMEANPPIYNTNFCNTTEEALSLIDEVDSPGFMLNLDVGTMIENKESVDILKGRVGRISHVHISEPYLNAIEKREIHLALKDLLVSEDYQGFVSIEMGNKNDIETVIEAVKYIGEIYGS